MMGKEHGRTSDAGGLIPRERDAHAEGRLENHLPALSVHGRELCRQDRGRPCRRADHDRARPERGAVRPARLVLLPAVLDCRDRGRLRRQPCPDALGAAGAGADLGAGAIPDGRHHRFHHTAGLPHHSRRRRRAGGVGRRSRRLQMVSRREARDADGHPVAGVCFRRHPCGAGAELGDRESRLALCVRRARRCRPDVERGVAVARPGGPAGGGRTGQRTRAAARTLSAASDQQDLRRLRSRDVRRLLGAVARSDLVHAVPGERSRLLAAGGRLHLDPALDLRCVRPADHGLAVATADGSRHEWRAACSAPRR